MHAAQSIEYSDYFVSATQHRPRDPARIATEIRRLHASGLTEHDIASAMRLDPAAVHQALEGFPR